MVTNEAIMKDEVTVSAESHHRLGRQEAKFTQLGSQYSVGRDMGSLTRCREQWWGEGL